MSGLLERILRRAKRVFAAPNVESPADNIDYSPWLHPSLSAHNLARFRNYSETIWSFAREQDARATKPLDLAFCVNIAQTAYKWACLAPVFGARATLYPHPLDTNALSMPEWEDFDGEFADVHDGRAFLALLPAEQKLRVECVRVPLDGQELNRVVRSARWEDRRILYRILSEGQYVIPVERFLAHEGTFPFFPLCQLLSKHDAILVPASPMLAYLSGRPFVAQTIGGDMQFEAGKGNAYGRLVGLAFNSAKFITFSNPYILGLCRRYGYANGLYLPYVMDDDRFTPGEGLARKQWVQEHGEGTYVLSSARIDDKVKGNGSDLLEALVQAARECPSLRYVFLRWGHSAQSFIDKVNSTGVGAQFIFRKPVGKARLIDYLRSCDAVLDQFVYGYYGATALEAAGVGKPVLMRILADQYSPLYRGDVAPVINLSGPEQLKAALIKLVEEPEWHRLRGKELRAWLVRNHGAKRTMPTLLGLLRLAADNIPLPIGLDNPLLDVESQEELEYHKACLKVRTAA